MKRASIPILTICGLEELEGHASGRVSHVLSILDPGWPDPTAFGAYEPHHRTVLRFHDAVEPAPGIVLPEDEHVAAILDFGRGLQHTAAQDREGHLLVHCHMGISRSTAAMATLLAQEHETRSETWVADRLLQIRPQAWPNLRIIEFADRQLARGGRLTAAVGALYARQLADRPHLDEVMRQHNRGREVELGLESRAV